MRSIGLKLAGLVVLSASAAMPACNRQENEPASDAQEQARSSDATDKLPTPALEAAGPQVEGWSAGPASAAPTPRQGDSTKPEPKPLTREEQLRYNRVARMLVEAINSKDKKTYRGLHTDEGWAGAIDWWQDMFARQTMRFGKIERAYAPRRGITRVGKMGFGGDARNGASFLAIFEDQVGGIFSFELNDEDKIRHTSVFIKEELASYQDFGEKPIYDNSK